jgi:transketolase
MRNSFVRALTAAATLDERIWLLTGDLGYSVLDVFSEQHPRRFVNVGVAEQNMTGVAAGLALSGKIVITYSIANFPTMRCLEQIRNDVCYHEANVKIVAIGGGLAYGTHGYTHHGIEDIAVMSAFPNMTVIAPGDPVETTLAVEAMLRTPGPCYLRLGKGGEPVVHDTPPAFRIGAAIPLREGTDVTLISTGAMLPDALAAARALADENVSAAVLSMPTVKPLDAAAVLAAARATPLLVTIEEHSVHGGLGSIVADCLATAAEPARARLVKYGLPEAHRLKSGSRQFMLGQLPPIADVVRSALGAGRRPALARPSR